MNGAAGYEEPLDHASARGIGVIAAWALYAAFATGAGLIFPPAFLLFLAPPVAAVLARAPKARAAPRRVALTLIYAAALLFVVWPVYLHVKLGPLPILTPPRLLIYALTAIWAYDMLASPVRRGRFLVALRRNAAFLLPFAALVALGAASIPLAQGKIVATGEFIRQTVIWTAPTLAILTYVRKERELVLVLKLVAAGAAASALVAVAESASSTLLASLLSPLIGDGQWLDLVREQKIRDGVFRAQAGHTHPLSLGELLAFAAPLAFGFLIAARRAAPRVVWGLALLTICAGVAATGSRAALLCLLATMTCAVVWQATRFLRRPHGAAFRPLAGLAALMLLAAAPLAGYAGYKVLIGAGGEQAARSSQGRADQIEQALPKILNRPVTGHGAGRAAVALGFWGNTLTIDNYYLTLALDLGVGGPIAFLAMAGGLAATSAARARRAKRATAPVLFGLAMAAASFVLTRSILSMTGNLAVFYIVLAAAAGVFAQSRRRRVREGVVR